MLSDTAWVLVGGFSIHLFNGCFFLWGNIAPYVLSYFYHFGGSDSLGQVTLTQADAVTVIPIMTIGLMIMNPIISSLKVNPKILIATGSTVALIGAFLSPQMKTFETFLITYACVVGVGIGFCYFPPLQCGWEWEPSRRGLVTGVILGAFGFGTFLFSILAQGICNPSNEHPTIVSALGSHFYSQQVASRFPTLFYSMAACWAVLGAIAVLLVRRNPQLKSDQQKSNQDIADMLTLSEGIRHPQFQMLFVMDICSIFTFMYMSSVYKTMAFQLGDQIDDLSLTIIGAIGGLVNGGVRIIYGYLQDTYGFKKIYTGIIICQLFVALTIIHTINYHFLYGVWVLLGYNCLGAHFVLFPTAMVKTYGIRAGSQLYSMLYIGIGAQQIGCMIMSFFLSRKLKSQVYSVMFVIAVGLTLISVIILYFYQDKVVRRSKYVPSKEIEQPLLIRSDKS